MNVMFCHNALCARPHDLDVGIPLHQEHDTGAWVPDACPTCGEDLYDEQLEYAAEEHLAALLVLTNRDLGNYDPLELMVAIAKDVVRQDDRRRKQQIARLRAMDSVRQSYVDAGKEPPIFEEARP